jgi:hypothetical protein
MSQKGWHIYPASFCLASDNFKCSKLGATVDNVTTPKPFRWRHMKNLLLLPILAAVLLVGCSEPVWQVRNIDFDQQQERNGITYAINEEAPYTGTVTESYGNGQKESEDYYVDGKKQGKHIRWYEDGQKKSEVDFVDGKEHGKVIEWHENDQKRYGADYFDGKCTSSAIMELFDPISKRHFSASCFSSLAC